MIGMSNHRNETHLYKLHISYMKPSGEPGFSGVKGNSLNITIHLHRLITPKRVPFNDPLTNTAEPPPLQRFSRSRQRGQTAGDGFIDLFRMAGLVENPRANGGFVVQDIQQFRAKVIYTFLFVAKKTRISWIAGWDFLVQI